MAKQWTILVFMAADNDLDRYALKNLHAAERIGSTERVNLVVQIDRRGGDDDQGARRGLVIKDPNWQRLPSDVSVSLPLMEPLGETNTGDPRVLRDFIVHGVANYPAERYGVIVWSHGSGWKPDFMYEAVEKSVPQLLEPMRAADFDRHYQNRTKRIVFRNTLDGAVDHFIRTSLIPGLQNPEDDRLRVDIDRTVGVFRDEPERFEDVLLRAIALDETQRDALDSLELIRALTEASQTLSGELGERFRYAFIGFDACLMNGLEVAEGLKHLTDVVIGSEEVEPAKGWPYDALLEAAEATSDAVELSRLHVHNYIESLQDYRIRLITHSSIRTARIQELATALNEFASRLIPLLETHYRQLAFAEKNATKFFDKDFVDIGSFLNVVATTNFPPEVVRAAEDLHALYSEVVIESCFDFNFDRQKPSGISLYLPSKEVFDPAYEQLPLHAGFRNWIEFIKQYHFLV